VVTEMLLARVRKASLTLSARQGAALALAHDFRKMKTKTATMTRRASQPPDE
jgi:hypothetical protein